MSAQIIKRQVITKGVGTCPDCGKPEAFVKTIQSHNYEGNPEPGFYLVVDCESCSYYEFTYQGADV